jgi:hypothetical protein
MFRVKFILAAPLLATGLFVVVPATALGQTPADPADASARVPALVHRSTFADYRSANDVEAGGWRDANEKVERIGGWRTYAKEAEDARAAEKKAGGNAAPVPHRHH